jgi:hypothetical protein
MGIMQTTLYNIRGEPVFTYGGDRMKTAIVAVFIGISLAEVDFSIEELHYIANGVRYLKDVDFNQTGLDAAIDAYEEAQAVD